MSAERKVRCRYTRRDGNPCPNEALNPDPDNGVVLCSRHLAAAAALFNELVRANGFTAA